MTSDHSTWETPRHKTALHRKGMSKPVRLAVEDGLLTPDISVLDYGCGRGEDVRQLKQLGITAHGWDPVYYPDGPKSPTHAVNLGYVINVIESPEERAGVLSAAWTLTERLLMVSARSSLEDASDEGAQPHGDGVLTRTGSFQKFYDQHELRKWIVEVLGVEPLSVAPGIFFVFKDETLRETWRSQRYRRRVIAPRISTRERLFQEHRDLLEKLMAFLSERGRLPKDSEVTFGGEIQRVFGSFNRAFQIIRSVTGETTWQGIRDGRKEDLLVWLALCRFQIRPIFSDLPNFLQWDVKSFYGSYNKACKHADYLLFSIGEIEIRESAIRQATFGKLMPKGLYIHVNHLEELSPVLRVYEGCARSLVGNVQGSNIIKFHRDCAQISYLTYDNFYNNPHPELIETMIVNLTDQKIRRKNYTKNHNRFILHRKEIFIPKNSDNWKKFHNLTVQEEKSGLFSDTTTIGTRIGWDLALNNAGVRLLGHRLVKTKK